MYNLQELSEDKKRAALGQMTLNNIIKAALVSQWPSIIQTLGVPREKGRTLLAAMREDAGIVPKETDEGTIPVSYPFFEPLPPDAFSEGTMPKITDLVCDIIREKYSQVGALLSYYQRKLAPVLTVSDSEAPYYILCVSTQLDLYRALVAVHRSFGQDFRLPELPKNGQMADDDPRQKSYLVPGTQSYEMYQRLNGNYSAERTSLEAILSEENIDAAIVVYPYVQNGVRVSVYRRKSPKSIGEKFAYSLLGYTLNMIRASGITNKKRDIRSRIATKYDTHKKVGAQDIAGIGIVDTTWEIDRIPYYIQSSGLGSLVNARDPEYINATDEVHWDLELKEYAERTGLIGVGRTEFHGFTDIQHYIGAQIIGPTARAYWKQRRMRELKEAYPYRDNKQVEVAYSMIKDTVTQIFMCNIGLAYFPNEYFAVNPHGLSVPAPRDMTLIPKVAEIDGKPSPIEGKYSLVNAF